MLSAVQACLHGDKRSALKIQLVFDGGFNPNNGGNHS